MRAFKAYLFPFLKWSERYTKTDMVYLASGGFWTTSAQIIAIVCSIPLSIAFANLLTPVEYGTYRYILTISAIVAAFTLTGLPAALLRAVARSYEGSLKMAFYLNIRWSIPAMVIAFIGAAYYVFQGNYVLAAGMGLIGIFVPYINVGSLFSSFLSGKKEFRINTSYSNRRTIIHTIAILLTLFLYPEPVVVLVAFFAIQAVTGLYYYYKTLRKFVRNDTTDPEMKNLGKHMSFLNLLGVLSDKLDAVLLFQFIGAAELAMYVFAEMVPDILSRFTKNITALAFPKLVNRKNSNGLWLKTFFITLVLLPAALLYIYFAPLIFSTFFSAYMASVPFTQALTVLALINGSLPSMYIDARGAIKIRYIINFLSLIIKIIAVVIGVLFWGIWGAILARYVSRIFSIGITWVALHFIKEPGVKDV